MSLTGKEKIYFLLNKIDDKRATTPSGQPILIHPLGDLNGHYPELELQMLFKKMQDDEKALKVVRLPLSEEEKGYNPRYEDDYFGLELLPTFDDYFAKIQLEPGYQEFSGRRPQVQQAHVQTEVKLHRKALEKIWNLLQEIEEKRGLTEGGEILITPLHISRVKNEREANDVVKERYDIVKKLENQEKAIKDVVWPDSLTMPVSLKIAEGYFDVLNKYEEAYKQSANNYQQIKQQEETVPSNIIYEIRFSEHTREILINNFLLKKLRSFSDNDVIFAHLYRNPNQEQSDEDIMRGITQDKYDSLLGKYKQIQADILLQMEQHSKADETYYIEASRLLELANRAYELFESSEDAQKRELLNFLLQNSKMDGDKLIPTLQMPFDAILDANKTNDWYRVRELNP